jgi:hypothetical protein
MLNIRKKKIYRHDSEKQFLDLLLEVQNKYPNEATKQISSVEGDDSKYELMILASLTQQYLNTDKGYISLSSGQLDLIYRSILDLTTHTQINLPSGVYDYSLGNLRGVTNYILENFSKNIDNKATFKKLNYESHKDISFFESKLSNISEQELITFAAELLERAFITIKRLSGMVLIDNQYTKEWLITRISNDVMHIPTCIAQRNIKELKTTLIDSLIFIKKLELSILENDYFLQDYKNLIKKYPQFF